MSDSKWFRGALLAVSAGVLLAACSSSSSTTTSGTGGTQGGGTPASSMSLSASNVSSVGQVLVNGSGFTLYLFTPEKGGTPACTGSCAATWPPVISPSASAAAMAGSGLQASDLGTVKLADGKFEVTYFGWPLHTYTGDTAAGQANGQGFGGQWFAITTQGTMAGGTGSPSGGSSSSGSTSGGGGGWG